VTVKTQASQTAMMMDFFRFHYANAAVALMQKPFYTLTCKRITHRLVMLEFCHENAYSDRRRDCERNKFQIRIFNQKRNIIKYASQQFIEFQKRIQSYLSNTSNYILCVTLNKTNS